MTTKKLSKEEVRHIAKLANLSLDENEVSKFQAELSDILQYVDKLQKVDTDNTEITNQVTGLVNVYRENDSVDEDRMFTQQQALSNTKVTHKGYIAVPAVISKS